MKKIIVLLICSLIFAGILAGCSGTETPYAAWADKETLTYSVADASGADRGEMTVVTVRNPSDKTVGGQEYSSADGRTDITLTFDGITEKVTILMKKFSAVAYSSEKTLADGSTETVTGYYSGKYFYYSENGGAEQKLKVGSSAYLPGEFLYNFVRCYPLESTPASMKIADIKEKRVATLTTTLYGRTTLTVPYPDGSKEVSCYAIAIGLAESPQGKPIYAFYTPDSADYNVSGLSISPSKKIPVKMIENDITYILTAIEVM